jgi:hypothetical protein
LIKGLSGRDCVFSVCRRSHGEATSARNTLHPINLGGFRGGSHLRWADRPTATPMAVVANANTLPLPASDMPVSSQWG